MDYRSLVVVSACLAAAAIPLLQACKGPDPGAITFEERPSTSSGDTQGSSTSSGGNNTSTSSGSSSSGDGGAVTITDVFKDPKTGTAVAFAFTAPDTVVNATAHGAETAPMNGKTCVKATCHADLTGFKWGAGGTVYGDINGADLPADQKQKLEIRILQPDGTVFGGSSIFPDDDGNFFLRSDDKVPPAGSRVGVRVNGGPTKMMSASIEGATGANCNGAGCHDTTRIYAQ